MSKSKGNVINPLEMVERYGADALRAALVFGTSPGADVVLSEDKIIGMRNFANKVWNIGRFLHMSSSPVILNGVKDPAKRNNGSRLDSSPDKSRDQNDTLNLLKKLEKECSQEEKKFHGYMKKYQFAKALETVYHFLWHRLADVYLEQLKDEIRSGNIVVTRELKTVFTKNLGFLHPFMPFVTEAVYQSLHGERSSLLEYRYLH